MKDIIASRVIARREGLGLTQGEVAAIAGMSQQGVQFIESGKSRRPRKLPEIAKALRTSPDWLCGQGDVDKPQSAPASSKLLQVIGRVEAGVFREALELDIEDRVELPVAVDPEYGNYKQYLLEVVGPSMDVYYPQGTYIHCAHIEFAPEDIMPRHGDHVVVERRSNGFSEATVKEFVITPQGFELWPRSNDPRHQQPVILNDTPVDEIQITGLVIGSYRKRARNGLPNR